MSILLTYTGLGQLPNISWLSQGGFTTTKQNICCIYISFNGKYFITNTICIFCHTLFICINPLPLPQQSTVCDPYDHIRYIWHANADWHWQTTPKSDIQSTLECGHGSVSPACEMWKSRQSNIHVIKYPCLSESD